MEQVNYNIPELTASVKLGESLDRLLNNRDFKKVIIDAYLETGSIMLTKNLSQVKHRENGKIDIINDEMIARSLLYKFISDIATMADGARQEIAEINADLAEQAEGR